MVNCEGPLQDFRKALGAFVDWVSREEVKPQEFREALAALDDFTVHLQDALESLLERSAVGEKDEWRRFWMLLAQKNSVKLCEELRKYGFSLRKKTEVYERIYDRDKKQPRGSAYRILELTRLGKRDEVFFSLLNVFQGTEISPDLARAFNPVYPDDLFRVFIYSFLSGLLGPQEKQLEEVEQ
ncbi:MAG: hypothetical protein ACPL7L_05955 [bacterium]